MIGDGFDIFVSFSNDRDRFRIGLRTVKEAATGYSVGKTYSNLQSFMSHPSQTIHRDSYAECNRLISMSQGTVPRVAVHKQSQQRWAVCHTDIAVQSQASGLSALRYQINYNN